MPPTGDFNLTTRIYQLKKEMLKRTNCHHRENEKTRHRCKQSAKNAYFQEVNMGGPSDASAIRDTDWVDDVLLE